MKNKSKKNEKINQILEENREEIESGQLVVYAIDECHLMGGDIVVEAWESQKNAWKYQLIIIKIDKLIMVH
jgi:hypothetical protein